MDEEHVFEPPSPEWRRRRASADNPNPNTPPRRTPSKHTSAQDATLLSDADTCRICRGEAAPDEPLFYPCKCSGSIKYVHQDCLMEWLSHSQKKHCELCKTPFRFTKLYAPDTPKSVPFHVFVSHITKYMFRNILVWARGGLVITVWLIWLPYLMRRVWTFLFWLSDEGLGPVFGKPEVASILGEGAMSSVAGSATCPSSPLHAQTTTAATLSGIVSQLPLSSHTQTTTSLYGINITSDSPLPNILLNMFLGSFYLGGNTSRNNASASLQNDTAAPAVTRYPTLLSEVRFFKQISSSSSTLGCFLVDVVEGQIITVLVIIAFILIILVRDYVVQQQPDINMRAAFAAAENPGPAENAAPAAFQPDPTEGLQAEDIDRHRRPEAQEDGLNGQALDKDEDAGDSHWHESRNLYGATIDEGRRSVVTFAELPDRADSPTAEASYRGTHLPSGRHTPPILPDLETVRAANPTVPGRSAVDEYVRIYRAAGGDPERILRIARQENLEGRLAYYLQVTQSRMDRNGSDFSTGDGDSSQVAEWGSEPDWTWPNEVQGEDNQYSGKGKSPMTNGAPDARDDQSHVTRPRSATDGPQRTGGINPLGYNNWSLSDISQDSPQTNHQQQLSPLENKASSSKPVQDATGSQSHAWAYATPPSSTLAESASSSSQGQTPSSSPHNDGVPNLVNADLIPGVVSDAELAEMEVESWATMPELNEQLDLQQAAEARADGGMAREQPQRAGLAQRVANFMWQDVDAIPPHELPPLQDANDDFFDHEQDAAVAIAEGPLPQAQERDQEVVAAAAAAGIDAEAEAIEDVEDLEGILELLGMRGPIAGLFQNALFCAFLVSITLFLGVFMPYNLGRISIWLVANPTRPVRILFSLSKLVQDTALLLVGFASTLVFGALDSILALAKIGGPQPAMMRQTIQGSWNMTENAAKRLLDSFMTDRPFITAEEVRNFSIVSHGALLALKGQTASLLATIGKCILFVFGGAYPAKIADAISWVSLASATAWQGLKDLPDLVSTPSSWVIDLSTSESAVPLDAELASWGAMDRIWAVLGGYVTLSVAAALYLGRGGPISPGRVGQEWEATLIDALTQASGVMKVILIIGIEMLVFPLYCGLLLDVALLPLFEHTTVMSRVMFTVNYPLTSIFVHWFVGTGYMFHFALFVSMCRKIMRKGVLYFIRDPDDAEFHPVRDVLERNVTTQLRKILFSAFVYGALVIVCLGGVVWALSYGFHNVLPIHYSSNEPVLEFPIDLLFYNFLMPLAVKFFKPSDGLHAMYTWWFRKTARALRLTWFLFGERKIDEEGTIQLGPASPAQVLPWWKKIFLEFDGEVIPKTWKGTFEGGKAKPAPPPSHEDLKSLDSTKALLVNTQQLVPDGRFVRAPASDQVKIPKGHKVFMGVTQYNERQDGKADRATTDIYSTSQYQFVYIPPDFRLRVFLFILFIWIFAAATGLGFTIIPLIFGRWMFRMLIPEHIRTNDIYAFSIGIYILGSLAYFLFHIKETYDKAREWVRNTVSTLIDRDTLQRAAAVASKTAKLFYAYFFLLVAFPLMVASLMELYFLIPLDTYMYGAVVSNSITSVTPSASDTKLLNMQNPRHTIRVMQSWTIGVLYLKLAARFVVSWYRDSRLAAATRAVLRRGWLEPDVKVLTRAFVVPGVTVFVAAVFGPPLMAKACIWYDAGANTPTDAATDAVIHVLVYRFCFVAALLAAVGFAMLRSMLGVFRSWKVRIRDEAYLVGERLHNFSSPQIAQTAHAHNQERERRRVRIGWD